MAEHLADVAEEGVVTMEGCPNPGYAINISVNLVQRVVARIDDRTPPMFPINIEFPTPPIHFPQR